MSAREYDSNGFLIVRDNPIAKAGVFEYLGKELNSLHNVDKEKVYKVYKPFENLQENASAFVGMPIKWNHQWVGKGEDATEADGAIFGNVRAEKPFIRGDIIIYNPELIKVIESGEAIELSPALNVTHEFAKGTYDDEPFEVIQKIINVNHLAVVEAGRGGKDLRILDKAMQKKDKGDFMAKMSFKQIADALIQRIKDSAEAEDKEGVCDSDRVEKIKEIITIASKDDAEFENGIDDKIKAIEELIGALAEVSEANDENEAKDEAKDNEVKDNDEVEVEVKETEAQAFENNDTLEIKPSELVEAIEKIADAKINALKKSMRKENERVLDSYAQVSKALGASFDYRGKTPQEIYKFGYEALTKQKIADSADAKTAFETALMFKGLQTNKTQERVSDSKGANQSKLEALIAKHK